MAQDPLIGTELGDYRIEAPVGRGGMGVVYRAEQMRLRRCVALKVIAPELAADPTFRERFEREAQPAAVDRPSERRPHPRRRARATAALYIVDAATWRAPTSRR